MFKTAMQLLNKFKFFFLLNHLIVDMPIVEEIISLYRVPEYNCDMFALRYQLNINYRLFETLVM